MLRKRHENDAPRIDEWTRTTSHDVPVHTRGVPNGTTSFRVNDYFLQHPEQVLGDFVTTTGVRGSFQLGVTLPTSTTLAEQLPAALSRVTDRAQAPGLVMDTPEPLAPSLYLTATTPEPAAAPAPAPDVAEAPASIRWDGHIATAGDDFVQYVNGQPEALAVPKSPATRRELRALLPRRDAGTGLLPSEAQPEGDSPQLPP